MSRRTELLAAELAAAAAEEAYTETKALYPTAVCTSGCGRPLPGHPEHAAVTDARAALGEARRRFRTLRAELPPDPSDPNVAVSPATVKAAAKGGKLG